VTAAGTDRETRDAVIIGGCGRVGLPLGIALASRGRTVTLYDINAAAVDTVNGGCLPFDEDGAAEPLRAAVANGNLDATTDPGNIIDGTNAGLATNGLTVNSANVTIKGLEIDDFTGDGILVNASNSAIGQNSIGVFGGNGGNGINIAAGTGAAIGGTVGANTIETNGGAGIAIAANSSVVVGNTIGDFGAGNSGDGITLSGSASNNQIGSDTNGVRVRGSGTLYLGVNDETLDDNSGSFRVTVYY